MKIILNKKTSACVMPRKAAFEKFWNKKTPPCFLSRRGLPIDRGPVFYRLLLLEAFSGLTLA